MALLERCARLLFAGKTLASRDLDSSRLVTLGVDSRSRRWAEDRGGGGGINKRKKRASRQASSSSWHLVIKKSLFRMWSTVRTVLYELICNFPLSFQNY